jgi:hypothetical protein
MPEEGGSKLGAVAPHRAVDRPLAGPPDSSTWPREGAAFPVASPSGKERKRPRAPPRKIAKRSTKAVAGNAVPDGEASLGDAPKPRSGSEKRQRKHVARIRLDDAEQAKLDERASAAGLSLGAYLRAASLGAAGVRAKPRASVDRELLARSNADLNRVGNNINQIAHALNIGLDPPHILADAMTDLRGVLSALRRAAGYDSQG